MLQEQTSQITESLLKAILEEKQRRQALAVADQFPLIAQFKRQEALENLIFFSSPPSVPTAVNKLLTQIEAAYPQAGGVLQREYLTFLAELVLAPFLDRASTGGILVVGQVKAEIEARLGRSMALSSVYNLLHRHGWRKLAPDKRHPQSDPLAQQEWKKNSPSVSPRSARSGPAKPRSG